MAVLDGLSPKRRDAKNATPVWQVEVRINVARHYPPLTAALRFCRLRDGEVTMKRHRGYVPGLFVLLLSCPAFGQGLIAFSGNFGGTPDGGFQGTATFHVPLISPRPVVNAPYAGQQVHESVQTLADGTHITRQMMGASPMTYRDSQGRVRMEQQFGGGGGVLKNVPTLVQISDPVSGYAYIMDDVNRVAHRVALPAAGQRTSAALGRRPNTVPTTATAGAGGGGGSVRMGVLSGTIGPPAEGQANRPAAARVRANIAPDQISTESLGTQTVDGVQAQGTRVTRVIPTGAQGNDAPITITTDNWYSPELQLTLLTVTTDPRSGVQTTKYNNFSQAEPDPGLFVVPAGYATVDETNDFTIRWGQQ
jgi:hypothetical protein